MKTVLVLAALLLAGRQEPALSEERVVLRTSRGDLTLALYPGVAPRQVNHFLRLIRKGVYDGSFFDLARPGFMIRNSGDFGRVGTLSADQAQLVRRRIQAEFSILRHVRGSLSMSRDADDINSARTSFMILLADAPQLDGKYTIFGRIVGGDDVLAAIAAGEGDSEGRLGTPVQVLKAFVPGDKAAAREDPSELRWLLGVGGAAAALGLAAYLLAGRVLPRAAGPLGLVLVFVGFFAGFVGAVPLTVGARSSAAGLALFLCMLALFKLMNRFEGPASRPGGSQGPSAKIRPMRILVYGGVTIAWICIAALITRDLLGGSPPQWVFIGFAVAWIATAEVLAWRDRKRIPPPGGRV